MLLIDLAPKKAVVLMSGGIDSSTTLAFAKKKDFSCYALTINYGQRHHIEIEFAKKICKTFDVEMHKIIDIDLTSIGGSALTDPAIRVPESLASGIPVTYVPARNTIMLSVALGWAEVIDADTIFVGANAIDYSGYPDCRPEYIDSFERMANLATKRGLEGREIRISAPLINMTKASIIKLGASLNVDFSATVSCYQANSSGAACGLCDSCRIRRNGFEKARVPDPTIYY
jgi:7-cyano-7-deazaguanine synthase